MKKIHKRIIILTCAISLIILFSNIYINANEITSTIVNTTSNISENKISNIKLNKTTLNITIGKKGVLKARVIYKKNENHSNEHYLWSSKNNNIATVDQNGIVKAISLGSTYVYCSNSDGSVKARCKIIVRKPYNKIKSISFIQKELRLNKGDKRTLKPTIKYGKKNKFTSEPVSYKSSNHKIATVSSNGIVKGKKNGSTYVTIRSKFTNKSAKCKIIVQKVKYVAVTFDDGPGDYTDKLLEALKDNNSKATFFIVGNRIKNYQSQLKKEFDYGMEIGSHSFSHANLKASSKVEIENQINKTNAAVKKVTGTKPTVFRPPYGNYNKTVSKKVGAPMIYWTVDTMDWKYKKTKYVYKSLKKQTRSGEIILMHDIHKTTVNGFIKALPELRKQGYEFVTVSELYKLSNKKMKNGKMYYGPKHDK